MKTMCPLVCHHNNLLMAQRYITILQKCNGIYACFVSARCEHSVCCGSLRTTCITLLAWLVEHSSLVHWHQQCVTVHHVPKWMSYHKAIVVITGRAHCFPSSVLIHLRVFNLTCLKQRFDDFLFQVSFYMYNLQSILSMFLHGTIYNNR